MTSQPSHPADSEHLEAQIPAVPEAVVDTEASAVPLEVAVAPEQGLLEGDAPAETLPTHPAAFGSRLRAAREARNLSAESCAHALKLPTRVIRQLENNEYEGIDYQVYLAGYLSKYARYLGIDDEDVKAELARVKPGQPILVATGGISHSRYLLENYARAATYVVLTAAIVVPTIWLGVRGTLDRDAGHLSPLDATPVAQMDTRAPVLAGSSAVPAGSTSVAIADKSANVASVATASQQQPAAATPAASSTTADQQPLMASMTPFPNLSANAKPAQEPAQDDTTDTVVVGGGVHTLELTLRDASWVEVTAQDGTHLEYGTLSAGTSKVYHSIQPLEVRIGNSGGAQVTLDGKVMELDGFRHSDVAHFRVEVRDGKASPTGV